MPHSIEHARRLRQGQRLYQEVAAGTIIIAAEGRISILMPAIWLGGQFHQSAFGLAEGEAHVMRDSAWLQILAHTEAELVFQVKESFLAALVRKAISRLGSHLPLPVVIKRSPAKT